ncbi:Protein required for attachment to host cells [Rickettsia monacensis]|uniref:Protein required for attachment to host cells n=1 Tax=Rickettsia monacensis TaxID=109232 RepID=A0A0B7J0E0_9RICK|nr:host attachment protein [Rickettsia monacensis]CDI30039.1 Protein required for attachment to host cells [Rickettsia monacensis IrR/Munich]CEO17637.1 Protein required for attachment to host cells [Rickettsia monacensis]
MVSTAPLKLIAVIDSKQIMLYDAQGVKITTNKPLKLSLDLEEHHNHREKRQSPYQNKSGSLFEPHTSLKDIEHKEAARSVIKHLEKVTTADQAKYKELIIVAEPQMLGCVRQELKNGLKKMITKEIAKDLVQHSVDA